MEQLTIEDTSGPSARVLRLAGPLTMSTLFEFQNMVRQRSGHLILDLAGVPFMDSAGLGSLLGAYASCQKNGHKFALVAVTARIETLMRISRVNGILATYSTLEEAERQIPGALSA
jgi:anti-anti-sigma factor